MTGNTFVSKTWRSRSEAGGRRAAGGHRGPPQKIASRLGGTADQVSRVRLNRTCRRSRSRPPRKSPVRRGPVERMPPSLGAGRALGPDRVLVVRAGDHPDWTAVLDIEERGAADVPPAGVEPVERGGDVVALVALA